MFLIFFLASVAQAQKQVNSPYSRFNLGTLEPAGSFKSQGMGGASIALRDKSSIFFTNPASYSSFDTTSFIFDFGFDYSLNKIKSGTTRYQSDDMNFDHLMFGFPVAKGFGVAAGIVPLSNGYYNITDKVLTTDVVDGYTANHKGVGGLSNFFIGTGLRINKNLSAGINMSVMFGEIKRSNFFEFEDYENNFHNSSSEVLRVNGINIDYGLQFMLPLRDKNFFNAGLSLTTGKNYKSGYEQFSYRYNYYNSSDTISYTSSNSEKVYIPRTLRAGIAFGKTDKLTVAVDYITTNWSKARIPGTSGTFGDNSTLSFGAEYTPDKYSNLSGLDRIDYRLGGHTGKSYVVINGELVRETGISAGFGLPLRRSLSKANIFFDLTHRGGASGSSLPSEYFITVGASINLYDIWFRQLKYD
ncbi:MAG TPA: hypothetical protein VK213_02815 [Bacteroidales bacterium]|nr:hypothetical protein [Bacteroidales bacterium]